MIREVHSGYTPSVRPAADRLAAAHAGAEAQIATPGDSAELSGKAGFDLAKVLRSTAAEAASLAKKLPEHVEGEVLVKLKPGFTAQAMDSFANDYGATVAYRFDVPDNIYQKFGGDLLQIQLPAGMTTAEAMAAMGKDKRVAYACSNDVLKSFGPSAAPVVPNDLDPQLWGLNNTGQDRGKADADIDAPEAWAISTGSRSGPVVTVIDTGVDYTHPDLKNNAWVNKGEIPGNNRDDDGNGVVDDVHGYNAINDSGDPMDDNAHGTHCAGSIGGEGDNGQGVVGVNWNAQIMGAKFLSGSGSGTTADAVKATLYATKMGARITSNSWGGGGFNQALYDALKASPALHIFAAGNESNDNDARPSYPATYDLGNIVSVAASDRNDQLASFSNWGATTVDLAAPGVDILSTVPGGKFDSYSGTSMATPHVAGAATLIATVYPDATNDQIISRLMNGVDPVAEFAGKMVSGGRLNLLNALENDTTAPGAPSDLKAGEASSTSVKLEWVASGDDGNAGKASAYRLRMSSTPIDDATWDQAAPVPTGAPGESGATESASVRVLPSGSERKLYFGLKSVDNVGNSSALQTIEVTVPAATVAFEDTMDAGVANWTATGAWAQVDEPGRGKVWTDSPTGEYGNDQDTGITSRKISLAGLKGSTLMFDAKYDTESGYDNFIAEVSGNGTDWSELSKVSGTNGWQTFSHDLSAFDGQDVQVRFRLKTDGSVSKDGVAIDTVVIAGDRA